MHGLAQARGVTNAAVCTDCHGSHDLHRATNPASKLYWQHLPSTCGTCHENIKQTYLRSVHGMAVAAGQRDAPVCTDCHGEHSIDAVKLATSKVFPSKIPETCGQCHAGVSAQVAKGQIHSGTQPGIEHRVTGLVRRLYLWLIGLVIGGMLLHNLLDFRRKLQEHYERQRRRGQPLRMTVNERAQHGLLALAFVTLAYTGFALKFPQAWWASPFIGRFDWRSVGHRMAALLFVTLGAYHVWFMACTARGRHELRARLPRRHDLVQPLQMLAYDLGRRRERPVLQRYSYVEKAEYWALVWGSMVMAATGGLLTWEGWTLRIFPKWMFDVVTAVHYYEAILACLAIVVWHFYFVIFDPDEYPMKWTWVTGQASDADRAHRRDDDHGPCTPEDPPS